MAELDYGKEKMDTYRRSADRVGEPQPSFELCPGRVGPVQTTVGTYLTGTYLEIERTAIG